MSATNTPRRMVDYALIYLAHGWSVVPLHEARHGVCTCAKGKDCDTPGKHPRVSWTPYQADLPTEDEVRDWWRRWPTANIGVITGAVSGIIVLDIDGPEGMQTLQERGYPLPLTAVSETGRGWHYVYRHPGGDCRNFAGRAGQTILPGVDFRGDGGLFVAPPSLHHSGRRYKWSLPPKEAGIADPPAWLVELIRRQASEHSEVGRRLAADDWSVDIREGARNVELTRRAGALLAGGKMEPAEALTMLLAWNERHCRPPLPEDEVRRIVASIARKEASKPQSQGGKQEKPERQTRPILLCAADVAPQEPRWLYKPYIPRGAVTGLAGDPGIGKSFIMCDLAARVTRGGPWPTPTGLTHLPGDDALAEPGRVIYASAEDDIAKTLRPRLETLGADLTRVFFLTGKEIEPDPNEPQKEPVRGPVFLVDEALEKAIADVRPDLVIIDPIQAFLGPAVDMNKAEQVRPLLARLARVAEQYDCAIVVVGHLTKSGKDRAIYRLLGSVDLVGAIRSLLLAGTDPRDKSRRGLFHVKSNLAREGPALGYTIEDDGRLGRFRWLGGTDLTAAQVLAPEPTADEESAVGAAVEYLRQAVADGTRDSKTILRDAKAQGISERTLWRAKAHLGIRARKHGKEWVWELPSAGTRAAMREDGRLGRDGSLPEMTGPAGHESSLPTAQVGKVAKSAKSANQVCQGEKADTIDISSKSAKSAKVRHAPLVDRIATADQPPAALCEPARMGDGTCARCNGRRRWRAPDGRWLCSTCYPPVETLRQWEPEAA